MGKRRMMPEPYVASVGATKYRWDVVWFNPRPVLRKNGKPDMRFTASRAWSAMRTGSPLSRVFSDA